MKSHFSKIASGVTLSMLALTSAFAGIDDRLDSLEKEMQEISARNPQDTLGAGFTTSRPDTVGNNWFVTLDLIYWHTKMGNTEYAYSVHPNFASGRVLPQVDGDIKVNDFGWDLGVKAGLGYKTPHDSWDVYAQYTYFNGDTTSHSTKQEPAALIPLTNFGPLFCTKVKSHIDIDLNNIELELARSFFLSSKLAFRPHIDIKSTWLDISQGVHMTISSIDNNDNTVGLDHKTKADSKFWGLGPRAGFDSQWFLGYGFHIFGELAGSVQYGYFKTLQKEFLPPSQNPLLPNGEAYKLKHKFHRFIPSAEMYLGLAWGTFMNEDKQHLGLKLGYEVQYYWRVNQISYPDDFTSGAQNNVVQARLSLDKGSEDLMFYGITGEARLDF